MEAIKLKEYVTSNGLNIDENKLRKFKNQMVEIIILPIDNDYETIKDFRKYAGTLSESDAEMILSGVEECRKVDGEGWT